MTQRFKRLSHSIYECKYHISVLSEVPIPDLEGCDRGIGAADGVSILQTKGSGGSAGAEHTA